MLISRVGNQFTQELSSEVNPLALQNACNLRIVSSEDAASSKQIGMKLIHLWAIITTVAAS